MRKDLLFAFVVLVLIACAGGGAVWLSDSRMMPPSQTMHVTLPDDRIPR